MTTRAKTARCSWTCYAPRVQKTRSARLHRLSLVAQPLNQLALIQLFIYFSLSWRVIFRRRLICDSYSGSCSAWLKCPQRIAALANLAIIQIQHTILLQRTGHASSSGVRPLNVLAAGAQTSILPSESSVSASGVARKHRGVSDAEVNAASSVSSSPALLGAQCQDEVRRSHAASSSTRPMSPPISHLRPSPPRHRPSPPSPYEVPSRSAASSSSSSVSPPTQARPLGSVKAPASSTKSSSTSQLQLRQYPPNPPKKPSAPGASRKPLAHLLAPLPTHSSLYLSSRRQKSSTIDSTDGQLQPATRSPPLHLSMHQKTTSQSACGFRYGHHNERWYSGA